jgi:hypothetical protein
MSVSNMYVKLTKEFVDNILVSETASNLEKLTDRYFDEICKIRPSRTILFDNPKESMIWFAAKEFQLLFLAYCPRNNKGYAPEAKESLSTSASSLILLAKFYKE